MNKIQKLKKKFKKYKIDGYIIPKNDEFFGEYVSEENDRLKYISSFTGSSGFALILKKKIIYLSTVVIHYRPIFKVAKTLKL